MKIKKVLAVMITLSLMTAAFTACSEQSEQSSVKGDNTAPVSEQTESALASTPAESTEANGETTLSGETTVSGETTSSVGETAANNAAKTTTAKSGKASSKTTTGKSKSKSTTTAKSKSKSGNTTTTAKSGSGNSADNSKTTAKTTAKKTTKATTKATTTTTTQAQTTIGIKLTKNGNAECKSSNVTVDAPSLLETEGVVYIEKGGDYVITSDVDTWHGQIVIKLANTEKANIRIENVNITSQKANVIKILDTNVSAERSFIEAEAATSSSSGDTDNALRSEMKLVSKQEKAPNVDLSFPTGTTSSFSTGANKLSGVIYNESKLTIKGNGTVNVSATTNRNNAICSTKSITFKNVTANLSTAANTSISSLSSARGIFTFSKIYVESGKLNIKSNGDGIRCEEFNSLGGTTNIVSSASDGIDADDGIIITGGSVTAVGQQKSCFKVRRVNNQEKIDGGDTTVDKDDGVKNADHTFKIDGGTVVGMGKNITTVQPASKQASITCRSVKALNSTEAKKTIPFTIKGTGVDVTSSAACIKYLYSSPSIDRTKAYTVSSAGYTSQSVTFSGTVGDVRIAANTATN